MPLSKKGYVQMEEQLLVKGAETAAPALAEQTKAKGNEVSYASENGAISVKGKDFAVKFDTKTGAI